MLKIGPLQLKSKFILAPMAGITDLPFRLLAREFGAELAFVEMINCRSISHKSRKTKEMLATNSVDRPLGIQLLGSEPKFIRRALEIVNGYDFDILDFNAACPAKKVIRRQEGSALLKDLKKLQSILRLVVEHSRFPVTVKLRSGWDRDSINAAEAALLAQDCGVKAIFIHGRTRMDGYKGRVDYSAIAAAKKKVGIPVIASGDIMSGELIKKMFEETNCDAVAIARGSLGNPWIFRAAHAFGKSIPEPELPGVEETASVMKRHFTMCLEFYPERIAVIKFRKFFAWYTKGFRDVRALRQDASQAKTACDMLSLIDKCQALATKKPQFCGVFCR